MKNKKDFIYEYSDLNLFYTRVKILTGKYSDVILEFGASNLVVLTNKPGGTFNFDYIIYDIPERLKDTKLRGTEEFEKYLSNLLITIIDDRKKSKKEHKKLMKAASAEGTISEIKIDKKYYNPTIEYIT
jgi:hypothetical protein